MLGLFLRFFPVAKYMAWLEMLDKKKPGPSSSRHHIPWSLGMFLRFLGLLVQMCIYPAPNIEWHWRWPAGLPDMRGGGSAACSFKKWMREVVFKRYWKFACIPGIWGGVEEQELDNEGRTAVYQVCIYFVFKKHNIFF